MLLIIAAENRIELGIGSVWRKFFALLLLPSRKEYFEREGRYCSGSLITNLVQNASRIPAKVIWHPITKIIRIDLTAQNSKNEPVQDNLTANLFVTPAFSTVFFKEQTRSLPWISFWAQQELIFNAVLPIKIPSSG